MAKEGWIKLHRKILDNPVIFKDQDYLAVWIYLLLQATHTEQKRDFAGSFIMLQPGQLITGRPMISKQTKVTESKVQRVLKMLESEQQIEQQTSTKGRLITILNWEEYQKSEQQTEQQVDSNWTATEQQVNTNKNVKNVNNVKNDNNTYTDTNSENHVAQDSTDLSKHDDKCVNNKSSTDLDKKISTVENFFTQHIKQNLLSANDMVAITGACEKYSVEEIERVMQGVAKSNTNVNSFNYILRILESPKTNNRKGYYPIKKDEENTHSTENETSDAERKSIEALIRKRKQTS